MNRITLITGAVVGPLLTCSVPLNLILAPGSKCFVDEQTRLVLKLIYVLSSLWPSWSMTFQKP